MKNAYHLLYVGKDGSVVLVPEEGCEDGTPKELRSQSAANSEGRGLMNAGTAVRYKVLKVVEDHAGA